MRVGEHEAIHDVGQQPSTINAVVPAAGASFRADGSERIVVQHDWVVSGPASGARVI